MNQVKIREITGIKSIEKLIEHLNIVKNTFENDSIEVLLIHGIDKNECIIQFKRIKNNE